MSTAILASILAPAVTTFIIGIIITPSLTNLLYKYKIWKKTSVIKSIDGKEATISAKLHNDTNVKIPRMGGLVIWGSVFLSAVLFYIISKYSDPGSISSKLDFISRSQTWLPFSALIVGGLLGAIDDLSVVEFFRKSGTYVGGGLSLKVRLAVVFIVGLFTAYWFVVKLGMHTITIPFLGLVEVSPMMYGSLVIITMIAVFAGGIIDGVDGLSGGVMTAIFSAYGVIAMIRDQFDIAKLCFVIVAAILAFLWFNIPPARFYMSETGMIALSLCLSVVVFMVDGIAYLPVIGFLLFATVASVIIQLLSKKFRGKKVFLVAPIHHHFEAIGWPNYKVTMRYWIIAYVTAMFGVLLSII